MSRANAAPPPVGTEDYNIMMPYAAWVVQQKTQSGLSCCDIADGRPVNIRSTAHGWEAYISKTKFGSSAPDAWLPIPDSAILHVANPTGVAVAWWYMGSIRCFVFGPDG